jgi:hypothetical protein
MKSIFYSLAALTLVAAAPMSAKAAFLRIDDYSEQITVTANDFEAGLFINGSLFQQGLNNPATGTYPEGAANPLSFAGSWIDRGQTPGATHTVYFVEAEDPTTVSDVLIYTTSTDGQLGHIVGSFTSDDEGGLGTVPAVLPPDASVFVENGQDYDFSQPFLTALAGSDAAAVPVPAGLVLAGTGIASLAGYRRRMRKVTA